MNFERKPMEFQRYSFLGVANRIPFIHPIPLVSGRSYLGIGGGSVFQNYGSTTSQKKNLSRLYSPVRRWEVKYYRNRIRMVEMRGVEPLSKEDPTLASTA